ncbi:cyclodehydratase [soil metagenome]
MNSPTLRLDPQHPLVWRSPTSLQIGVDNPLVVLTDVGEAEERLLHALRKGVSPDGLRMIGAKARASAKSVSAFLCRVSPALATQQRSPAHEQRVMVAGIGMAAQAIHDLLIASGLDSTLAPDSPATPTLAVLVSQWAVAPATAAHWLRRDIAHLAVVFSDERVRIGPLVHPGLGPCLHCVERHRIDDDPAWPAMAGQLFGHPAPAADPVTVAAASAMVARVCAQFAHSSGQPGLPPGRVLHLDARTGEVTENVQPVHPQCACRALPESAMAGESANDWHPSAPTRAPAAVGPG